MASAESHAPAVVTSRFHGSNRFAYAYINHDLNPRRTSL
jgi:hypothetical protein